MATLAGCTRSGGYRRCGRHHRIDQRSGGGAVRLSARRTHRTTGGAAHSGNIARGTPPAPNGLRCHRRAQPDEHRPEHCRGPQGRQQCPGRSQPQRHHTVDGTRAVSQHPRRQRAQTRRGRVADQRRTLPSIIRPGTHRNGTHRPEARQRRTIPPRQRGAVRDDRVLRDRTAGDHVHRHHPPGRPGRNLVEPEPAGRQNRRAVDHRQTLPNCCGRGRLGAFRGFRGARRGRRPLVRSLAGGGHQ